MALLLEERTGPPESPFKEQKFAIDNLKLYATPAFVLILSIELSMPHLHPDVPPYAQTRELTKPAVTGITSLYSIDVDGLSKTLECVL